MQRDETDWTGVAFGISLACLVAFQQFKLPPVLPRMIAAYGWDRSLAGGFMAVYAVALHRASDGNREGETGHRIDRHESAGERAVPAIGGDHAGQHRRQLELLEGDQTGKRNAEGNAGPVGIVTQHAARPKAPEPDDFAPLMQ